jgi:hypothetical protein
MLGAGKASLETLKRSNYFKVDLARTAFDLLCKGSRSGASPLLPPPRLTI